MSVGVRAVIRLGAIRHNLEIIRDKAPGARIMAVIKANAYGHGLVPVARSLADADCLAVARLGEAATLREAGIATPIALLPGVESEPDLAEALALELQLGVHSAIQAEWLERVGRANATIWLKIDTGMNRLGFRPADLPEMIVRLGECSAVADLRLMSHLANAEDADDDATAMQIERFCELADDFEGDISLANSAGVLGWEESLARLARRRGAGSVWMRPGLALYGISPFADSHGAEFGLAPAMRFESRLIAVKPLGRDEAVGYGGTWRAPRDTVLGIVAAGYGDGYSRFIPAGTPVVVNSRRVPVVGRISMDLTAVDLGPDADDQIGAAVLFWGDELPVEEIARMAATIPYQLVCGVAGRVDRMYEDQ